MNVPGIHCFRVFGVETGLLAPELLDVQHQVVQMLQNFQSLLRGQRILTSRVVGLKSDERTIMTMEN